MRIATLLLIPFTLLILSSFNSALSNPHQSADKPDLSSFRNEFNRHVDSVRVIALLTPV